MTIALPMKKIIIPNSLIITFTYLFISHATAETNMLYSLSSKTGALNTGFDLSYNISDKLNARLSVNNASGYNTDDNVDEPVNPSGSFSLLTGTMTSVDYHLFATNFRLSAGLLSTVSTLSDQDNKPHSSMDGQAYDLSNTHFSHITPYVGLGWQDGLAKENEWQFSVDAGVLISPADKVNAIPVAINNGLPNDNEQYGDSLQALPVISLETSYRF